MRGTTPVGVAVPSGAITTTEPPTCACSALRQRGAEDDAVGAGHEIGEAAFDHVLREPVAVRSSAGSTPRTVAPAMCVPLPSIAWLSTYGTAARTPGWRAVRCCSARQSRQRSRQPADGGVRGDRENPAAQLALEAVHDRQHHDQRGDTRASARMTDISATNDTKPRRCVERR